MIKTKAIQITRQEQWTQIIAVGDKTFLESVKAGLNGQALRRHIVEAEAGAYQLRETQEPYGDHVSLTVAGNEHPWG